jgi:hypothetical protein
LAPRDTLPPVLRLVLENAQKPHPREADEAGWKLALNPCSRDALEEYLQVALYRDDLYAATGLSAEGFDAADLEKVFSRCRLAVAAVSDQRVMRVGKAIYKVTSKALGRKSQSPGEGGL